MKKYVLIIAVCLFALNSTLKSQVLFSNLSYDEVVVKAKKEKKSYYIDLTASWCLPCKLMNETVFQDLMVKKYTNENYIALQLDVENFDAMIIKSEYKVSVLPTILFFNYKGKLIGRSEGLQTGSKFLEMLKKYDI